MNQGQYTGGQNQPGGNQQYLQPPNYDPRRLFPFGLSPIPEVPSELASEVSSIASYSPTPSLDDSDTEIESVRSRGSIMYSGSCDSVKSNLTLNRKSSSESGSDTEHDSSYEETEDEAEDYQVENLPKDAQVIEQINKEQPKETVVHVEERTASESSFATNFTDPGLGEPQDAGYGGDIVSGAATASEIFRHLQATRGKQEVTTELAKILNVLKTTLNDDKEESSSDEEQTPQDGKTFSKIPTGKPPKPPVSIKFSKNSVISPDIQARIKDLEQNKHGNPKEEMTLLSKILVHLLCSCKTTAAAQELKRIIRQFKEVAKVAMEEGDDMLESLRSSSRASSRSSKRRARSRTASGNSNISGNSETDSMNTLTPGDSKSSGTDDETAQDPNMNKLRFTSNVNVEKKDINMHSCVSYTLTLPLKKAEDEEDDYDENDEEYDEDEWEWEYEDEEEEHEIANKSLNESSGSSRNLTPSDASTGSTRKILNDMELGAYNTNSDPSHSNSQSTPITEEEDGLIEDEDGEQCKSQQAKKKMSEKSDNSEHLFCHLEETFKVLSDTYKIITTGGSTPDCNETNVQVQAHASPDNGNASFEDILDGVSTQCVQLETEIMKSSRQSTATPEPRPKSKAHSRPSSRSASRNLNSPRPMSRNNVNTSRPASQAASRPVSQAASRPVSRAKTKTPLIVEPEPVQAEEEYNEGEDWGEEGEWEYYYEEDYPEYDEVPKGNAVHQEKAASRPASRVLHRSRPASRQEIEIFNHSRPASQQKQVINKPDSRPSSRIVMRPASRNAGASRAASRCSVVNKIEEEDEEWGDEDEWEYYYEEDYQEEVPQESTKALSRPASRSIVRSRPATRQEILEHKMSRPCSRQSVKQENVVSRPASTIVKRPASNMSRPASRAVSRCSTIKNDDEEEEEWGEEDEWEYYYEEEYPEYKPEHAQTKAPSRPPSQQKAASRPPSRSKSQAKVSSRPQSVNKAKVNQQEEDEWEYYYEDDEEQADHSVRETCPPVIKVDNGLKLVSRPNSRNSVSNSNSRPVSRSGSRPVSRSGSRPGSRTASRLKMTSALGNVDEEDEDDWYEDDEDPELARFSPTLTTAPTTRATSPFPDEKGNVDTNTGTGFSRRKMSSIQESEESTPVPGTKTPSSRMSTATPSHDRRTVMSKTPTAMNSAHMNPIKEVSVCLAAEYLGKDADQLAASLPINFIEDNQVAKKKKHKSKSKEKSSDTGEDEKETKKKKKKSKRFLPKVGVKELANRLEPQLFQDADVGSKMTISKDEASCMIFDAKKKSQRRDVEEKVKSKSPVSQNEEKRRSVKEMVELISTNQVVTKSSSPPNPSNIPSISASSQMVMPPPPPHPYYAGQNQQYMGPQFQPYPMDVHGPYTQYPPQSPHSPYQPYPPQSPYQQYPPQQYYQGYQPPPPPPMPQHYQQYQQQYPPYHPQQMPSYPSYQQGYPPQQPMVYHSETNPNQMRVVSGGQTTVVNLRSNRSASRQRETSLPAKSTESHRRSPNDSEAYGTGSTGSDHTEGQVAGIDHDEQKDGDDGSGKPQKRHSRLFKLLQDSDYTDSSDGAESRSEYSSRISMKNMEDKHESDIDSVCSGLEKSSGIERKHSFRSHKSSNKESDNDSVHSGGVERKISPNSIQSLKQKRYMQLNLQSSFEPSSSELSTPNSPTVPLADWRRSQSKPPSRSYQYHGEDFDSHAGVSDDSSYQSLQSLNSFDSVYDANAGREVEEIMKRKVNRDSLYRYQTDSPSSYVRASPKNLDLVRASPKVTSSSPKSDGMSQPSPKLEQELLELSNFPSSPGLSLRQLQSHRSFYGSK